MLISLPVLSSRQSRRSKVINSIGFPKSDFYNEAAMIRGILSYVWNLSGDVPQSRRLLFFYSEKIGYYGNLEAYSQDTWCAWRVVLGLLTTVQDAR